MSSDTQPRVCIVGSGWHFTSGISYYTHRLADCLANENRVSVILMRRLIPQRFYPGRERVGRPDLRAPYRDDVDAFDGVDWYLVPSLFRALRFLIKQRPDVVVFQWWTGAVLHIYLVLAMIARALGSRVVLEIHETQDTGEARIPGVALYTRHAGRLFFRLATRFVVHSSYDLQVVATSHAPDPTSVRVIAHGPFSQGAKAAPRVRPDGDNDFVVLFFGTIRPYKGLEYLIEAFDALDPAEAEAIRLVIVGEPWEGWNKPFELIESSRWTHRIELHRRYVTDAEVSEFFADADAVALPYTRSSASGPLHIAMACGLPVVLSDVGGLRDGAAGYAGVRWVRPANVGDLQRALVGLLALRDRRFADPRSWDATARDYAALFDEVLTAVLA